MTQAKVAFRVEDSFNVAGAGDWIQPGTDVTVSSVQIDNQLERVRQPDASTPAGSRPGNIANTLDIEFTLTDFNWTDLVPGTGSLDTTGLTPTAEWFVDSDILDGSLAAGSEGVTLAGAAVESFDIDINEAEAVTVSLSVVSSNVSGNSPTSVVQPAVSDQFVGHGAEVSLNAAVVGAVQSATISASGLAERSAAAGSRSARAYYVGAVEPTVDLTAETTDTDQLELALGGSATSVSDTLGGPVGGEVSIENQSAVTETVGLSGLQPETFSFDQVVEAESLLQESTTLQATDIALP